MKLLRVAVAAVLVAACSDAAPDSSDSAQTAQGLGELPLLTTRAQAIAMMTEIDSEMADLVRLHTQLATDFATLSAAYQKLSNAATAVGSAAGGDSSQALLDATKQMQETQMSFNLQYLQLQTQMQNDNRQYTAVSNIMKTKHDTVKNSISNIR
jgi:hypothetical protein